MASAAISREQLDFFEWPVRNVLLAPWDDWHDPFYLDKLLLSPDKKPKNVILKSH